MRCLIYARVSQDPRGDHRSTTEQEHECRTWAEREGWTITGVITETGSASRYARSTTARTRWNDVTTALATGHYDALLTWEASRATRDLTAYTTLRDLCATHGVAWGYSGTLHDLTSRDARFRTGLDALLAEDESARTSERIRRAVRARATAGQPHGKLLYGYTREYDPTTGALARQIPHPITADIVRDIYNRCIDGWSNQRIANHLTEQGTPLPRPQRTNTRPDGQWLATTINRIINNPAYAGHRTHKGVIVGPATWEPLVTQRVWDQANAARTARTTGHRRTNGGTARHLLGGIARCGITTCSGPMYVISNRGRPAYKCHHCQSVTRDKARLDAYVADTLLALLQLDPGVITRPSPDTSTELEQARAHEQQLRDRHAEFLAEATTGGISAASLAVIEAGLLPQITAAARQVRTLQLPTQLRRLDPDNIPASWAALPLADQRAVLADALDVRVHPVGRGRRTAPMTESVTIVPLWGAAASSAPADETPHPSP